MSNVWKILYVNYFVLFYYHIYKHHIILFSSIVLIIIFNNKFMCHVTYLHQNVKYSAFNDYKKEIPKRGGYEPWAEHLSASIHPDLCLARAVVCDKTVPSRSLKTFFARLGEPVAQRTSSGPDLTGSSRGRPRGRVVRKWQTTRAGVEGGCVKAGRGEESGEDVRVGWEGEG